jgi:CMP/dCMP kinase
MIISINGPAGSGKSTVAKKLADILGWPFYNMGGIRRQKAKERGMTLMEYNKLGETDPSTDFEVDEYLQTLAQNEDNFIIDSRTAWHFIPNSVKIYIDVDEREAANRVFKELQENQARNEDSGLKSVEDVLASQQERKKCDIARYEKYYGIDMYDMANYDFVIDSTNLTREQVFNNVWGHIAVGLK